MGSAAVSAASVSVSLTEPNVRDPHSEGVFRALGLLDGTPSTARETRERPIFPLNAGAPGETPGGTGGAPVLPRKRLYTLSERRTPCDLLLLGRPRELHRFRCVGGTIEFAQLKEHFDFGRLAVRDVDPELDAAWVARARIEAVTPLEPWLALRTRRTGVAAHGVRFEHGTGRLRRFDAHAPAGAVGFLVSDVGVIAIQDRIVSVDIAEMLILSAAWNAGRCFDQLRCRCHNLSFNFRMCGCCKDSLGI